MIIYMPTLALVNSVSFRQMKDPSVFFSFVRVWGTIGWIVAGLIIGFAMNWESEGILQNTFYMAAGASAFLGIYSFFLPDTPPQVTPGQKTTVRDILGLDALRLLKDRNFLVFFVSSILICIPLAFYYQNANIYLNAAGMENAAGKMTFGQGSEIVFMLLLPLFLKRFGLTWAPGLFDISYLPMEMLAKESGCSSLVSYCTESVTISSLSPDRSIPIIKQVKR
jgi:hypothetical protein